MMQIAMRKKTDICQIRKDNFESQRLVVKMLLIVGNERNKDKWTNDEAKNSSNDFLFANSIFSLYWAGYMTFC